MINTFFGFQVFVNLLKKHAKINISKLLSVLENLINDTKFTASLIEKKHQLP